MVAALYTRLEATARRLIQSYGKDGAIVREVQSGPPYAPVIEQQVHVCRLVETGYSLTNRDATLIQAGDKLGIISTAVSVEPKLQDKLRIDGVDHAFVDLKPLNPGGLNLLFEFVARV